MSTRDSSLFFHRDPVTDLAEATWHTSSRSQSTNCVEVASLGRASGPEHRPVAVRDSKDRGGPVLIFTRARWIEFVAAAKDGEFDRN